MNSKIEKLAQKLSDEGLVVRVKGNKVLIKMVCRRLNWFTKKLFSPIDEEYAKFKGEALYRYYYGKKR